MSTSINKSQVSKLIGAQQWVIEAKIIVDGVEKILEPSIIKQIYIEEDIFKPYLHGFIVVDSWSEGIERNTSQTGRSNPIIDNIEYLHFRNDARDELILLLEPAEDATSLSLVEGLGFPEEYWSFQTKYIIYDKEDLGENINYKAKKFYFWDKNYQLMRERKIQWSTGIGTRFISDPPKEPIAHQKKSESEMWTGEAIASLLWDAGFKDYIDFEYWDWGATKINFRLGANQTVIDGINIILENHVSTEKYDQCLFIRDRFTRRYRLVPFWKIFEYAGSNINTPGPWQREHLFYNSRDENENHISTWKSPIIQNSTNNIDIKAHYWDNIDNYKFTDMAGIDSSLAMVSRPVHTHSQKLNQFTMEFNNNEIEKIREEFIKPYRVDFILGDFPLYTLNKTKTEQIAIDHKYAHNGSIDEDGYISRYSKGKNKLTFSNLFLNENMGLTLYGSTHRQAGMFVAIDKHGWSDNDFDEKLCGQWYAVNVVHNILHNKYINRLNMVKLHAFKEPKQAPKEDRW